MWEWCCFALSCTISTRARSVLTTFFGRTGHDWKQINAFKQGIAERVRRASAEVSDPESFRHFIALQANLMQLTEPMPWKASDYPKKDLDRLFSELVEGEARKTKGRSLRHLLGERFEKANISDKLRENISVEVPVFGKQVDIPYGFQNGRFNLITPAKFEAKETDAIFTTACKYAIEGRSLFDHPDDELGDLQLVVVGKFRSDDADGKAAARRVFEENSVEFYPFDLALNGRKLFVGTDAFDAGTARHAFHVGEVQRQSELDRVVAEASRALPNTKGSQRIVLKKIIVR